VFIFADRDIKTRQWIIAMVQLIINTTAIKYSKLLITRTSSAV